MELCKYNSYLEYLRERNSSIKNLIKYNDLLKEHNKVLKEDSEELNKKYPSVAVTKSLIPDDVE